MLDENPVRQVRLVVERFGAAAAACPTVDDGEHVDVAVVLLDARDESAIPVAEAALARWASRSPDVLVFGLQCPVMVDAVQMLRLAQARNACVVVPMGDATLDDVVPALTDGMLRPGLIGYSFADLASAAVPGSDGELHLWRPRDGEDDERTEEDVPIPLRESFYRSEVVHASVEGGERLTLFDLNRYGAAIERWLGWRAKAIFAAHTTGSPSTIVRVVSFSTSTWLVRELHAKRHARRGELEGAKAHRSFAVGPSAAAELGQQDDRFGDGDAPCPPREDCGRTFFKVYVDARDAVAKAQIDRALDLLPVAERDSTLIAVGHMSFEEAAVTSRRRGATLAIFDGGASLRDAHDLFEPFGFRSWSGSFGFGDVRALLRPPSVLVITRHPLPAPGRETSRLARSLEARRRAAVVRGQLVVAVVDPKFVPEHVDEVLRAALYVAEGELLVGVGCPMDDPPAAAPRLGVYSAISYEV